MPLSDAQKASLAAREAEAVAERSSSTAPVSAGADTVEVSTTWGYLLRNVGEHQSRQSAVHQNIDTYSAPSATMSRRLLDPAGFTYGVFSTPAPSGATQAWTSDVAREVTQLVLQSFGQPWHAFRAQGKWKGAMNEPGGRFLFSRLVTENFMVQAWVPFGTITEDNSMAHTKRFTTSFNSLLNSPKGDLGAHFIIDRKGNLYVTSDANNIYNSSGSLSATCVAIALEEAMYMDVSPSTLTIEDATWIPDGVSTLNTWDYSPQQYDTLATLIAKLQLAYPALAGTSYSTSPKSVDATFSGITMRGHIIGTASDVVDVYPHLDTSEKWEALYKKVEDKKSVIITTNVWQKNDESYMSQLSWVKEGVSSLGTDVLGQCRQTLTRASSDISGIYRADAEAQMNSASYRSSAAKKASNESDFQIRKYTTEQVLKQAVGTPLTLPKVLGPSSDDEGLF